MTRFADFHITVRLKSDLTKASKGDCREPDWPFTVDTDGFQRFAFSNSPRFDLYDGRREFPVSAKRRTFTMKEYQSLSHTRWDCKDHVVFIPKRRKKQIFGALRR